MGRLVYRPAEDSHLLLRHVERLVRGLVLDMGTGSGILAVGSAFRDEVERVVAVDIDPEAIREADGNIRGAGLKDKVDLLISDLFSALRPIGFDWIVFNPPYLPSEGIIDEPSWAGGAGGGETIERFLSQAQRYLKSEGGVLLVYSTLTEIKAVAFRGYEVENLDVFPLFYESIICVFLRPRPF